jgi:hypothetical protein
MATDRANEMQAERLREAQSVHGLPAGYQETDRRRTKRVAAAADPDSRPASWLERFFRRVVHRQKI